MKKKFMIYCGQKDTIDLMETRKVTMDKEKNRFQSEMTKGQDEFKDQIQNIDRVVMSFHQHQNITFHEEVAKTVADISKSLNEFQEKARLYNNREGLFGQEITDYSKLTQVIKDFTPYSNLWFTAHNWFKNSIDWLNCEWNQLDATAAEKFVEDGVRNLAGVIRFFKEKDIKPVLKIAEQVKAQVDEFKPKVPLMVGLRKQGMKPRHWQQISEKVGFEIYPDEGFTFQKVLDKDMMGHVDLCVEVGER